MKRLASAAFVFAALTIIGLALNAFSPETTDFLNTKASELTVVEMFVLVYIASSIGSSSS
jgi:hypothetical protein